MWRWLDDLLPFLSPFVPHAFGSMIGLRWAQNQTPWQKVFSFFTSFGLAVWFGPAIAEVLSLGPRSTVAVGILTAIVGMDIIGGVVAQSTSFRSSPIETFKAWLNAWKGKQ